MKSSFIPVGFVSTQQEIIRLHLQTAPPKVHNTPEPQESAGQTHSYSNSYSKTSSSCTCTCTSPPLGHQSPVRSNPTTIAELQDVERQRVVCKDRDREVKVKTTAATTTSEAEAEAEDMEGDDDAEQLEWVDNPIHTSLRARGALRCAALRSDPLLPAPSRFHS